MGNDGIIYHIGREWKRTHHCGELNKNLIGERVVIAGWVKKVRELGFLSFLDLWDKTGLVQLVAERDNGKLHELFTSLRAEDVVACAGVVRERPADMINADMATGEVEIVAENLIVLNRSDVPPFQVADEIRANEDLRLKYRYLDLRRETLQRNLEFRHGLSQGVRHFLSKRGFIEVETPMLVKRTPEGARDYLVPSRLQPGKFFALPQSPQLYKQILMVAGVDRYFQLARCLRDEDLRADRQPEHTQIDIEMSFIDEEDIYSLVEGLMKELFSSLLGIELEVPFARLDYSEAMSKYGSDKPDLRFDLEITNCSDIFEKSGFKVFSSIVSSGGVVRGVAFPSSEGFSRKHIGELERIARENGAGGLSYVKVSDGKISSPLEKFLSEEDVKILLSRFSVEKDGIVFMVGGDESMVSKSLGALRLRLGSMLEAVSSRKEFRFAWVNRFPLFLPSEDGGWEPAHHIFSMPLEEDMGFIDSDPGKVRGHLYDLVCNGTELGSGSLRVHNRQLQERLFKVIGIDSGEANRKFGFLLEAFQYGAPPHGGIAIGLDRLAMIMDGGETIRDYIAFPKTQSAASLMEGAPSEVEEELLQELHIKVIRDNRRNNKKQ
ncbi:MAG: aspartate--tRNA ligase [Candidatus Latescibacteria bacterium 4484_7]|nr:MAG: aspartate--tRNA ligase [Candidatus Latescibacteria bacterium 4484_7]